MNCRRHGRKPTLALWMLVAIADLAILTTAAGALVMLSMFATLSVLAAGVVAVRWPLAGRLSGGRTTHGHRRA